MRRRANKITSITKVLVFLLIATTLTGAAYGHWSKVVTIDARITTGSWDIQEIQGAGLIKKVDGIYCNDPDHANARTIRFYKKNKPIEYYPIHPSSKRVMKRIHFFRHILLPPQNQ